MSRFVTAILLWQNNFMKDRFWSAYYWIMIGYLTSAFLVLIISYFTWNDRQIELSSPLCGEFYMSNDSRCTQGADTPYFIRDMNDVIFFEFVAYRNKKCSDNVMGTTKSDEIYISCVESGINLDRYIEVKNYYPFLLFFLMTFIRWIVIGKHFWQRF